MRSLTLAAVLVLSFGACERPAGDRAEPNAELPPAASTGNFEEHVYERNFVFTNVAGDSVFMVPWLMEARTRPDGVRRRARGWFARGGSWDEFYSARWNGPPTRAPWRILPHAGLRLVVGASDAVEGIIFEEGPRKLELELGDELIEWGGPRGEVFRVLDAALYVSDQRVGGMALDMARAYASGKGSPGDWAFLVSGDSLQVVLENVEGAAPGSRGGYRGWARLDFRDLQWPELTVDWTEVRAFEPARQDVPMSWTISTSGDAVSGVLESHTARIEAGQGKGPLLPVDALFEVSGTLRIAGVPYPVRGLLRHTRSSS